MAIFDWTCFICGRTYKDLPAAPKKCQGCLRSVFYKVPTAPAIRFKGEGWTKPNTKED